MTYTIDANILVYAADRSSPFYERARSRVQRIFLDDELVYLFWPTVMAFLRIATRPGVFTDPLSTQEATDAVGGLLALAHVRAAGERDDFWTHYLSATAGMTVRGKLVPDAHIVALMRQYEVRRILTHDRDFRKFDGIEVADPFG